MKQKIYLHIGTHKTGSTSIQQTMFCHEDEWRAVGNFVPRYSDTRHHHHGLTEFWCPLPERFCSGMPCGDAWDLILSEIRNSDAAAAIISSEELSSARLDESALEYIQEKLADFDVTVIAYLRRQDDFLESCFKQVSLNHAQLTFKNYWDQVGTSASVHRDYTALSKLWQDAFGAEKVHFYEYDVVKNLEFGLVGHFALACGLDTVPAFLKGKTRANVSAANTAIATAKFLGDSAGEVPQVAVETIEAILNPHLAESKMELSLIPQKFRDEIFRSYIAKNAALNNDFTSYFLGESSPNRLTIEELLAVPSVTKQVITELSLKAA